jgi:TetR/AcrR family transcriptional regulator, transcriptional repressor for nem operon
VADLSEAMRLVLRRGTEAIVARLAQVLAEGVGDGSLTVDGAADTVAGSLYQLWLGASLVAKIERSTRPFDTALAATRHMLHLAP